MKRTIFYTCLQLLMPVLLTAQNVGVGTTNPLNKFHVQGGVSFTTAYSSTNKAPTPTQHITLINATSVALPAADSVARLYDPGGAAINYIANLNAAALINTGGDFLTITIEQVGLGAGDSLLIYDGTSTGSTVLYAIGNNISGSNISLNTSSGHAFIIFKSNADASLGTGFSLLVKRNYLDGGQTDQDGFAGNGVIFYPVKGSIKAGRLLQTSIGNHSIAIGNLTAATGANTVAMGSGSLASATNSIALGFNSKATALYATAIGAFATATGEAAVSAGRYTEAKGNNSFAIGASTEASGSYTFSTGFGTVAKGNISTSLGFNTLAKSYASLVIGRYNDTLPTENQNSWQAADRAFVIGDGTAELNRSSCFYILKNGNGWMQGTLTQASDARLKKSITPLQNVLPRLLKLKGYNYLWKNEENLPGLQAGLIAQEVQQQLPELVSSNTEGDLAVNYSGMIPYLLEGIREQQQLIGDLQEELNILKEKIKNLSGGRLSQKRKKI